MQPNKSNPGSAPGRRFTASITVHKSKVLDLRKKIRKSKGATNI